MKQMATLRKFILIISGLIFFLSCSKSGGGNPGGNTSGNTGGTLFPLAVGNQWNYKLRVYDTSTGATIDTSFFTLIISGTFTANGADYYIFENSLDTSIVTLTNINSTTLGSIDSAYGINYYTFFVSGSGDSTQSVNSWPVAVAAGGGTCQGTDKLYAHYADTTLVNLDGITYTNSMKNVIITYDCSGNKQYANVYFIKEGVGMVRYARYVYNSAGLYFLQLAWVLESQTLH
jgi:hypothetical protein